MRMNTGESANPVPNGGLDSPLVVRIPPKLRTLIDKEAERLNIPVSAVVRQVLSAHFDPNLSVENVRAVALSVQRQLARIATGMLLVFSVVGSWTIGIVVL